MYEVNILSDCIGPNKVRIFTCSVITWKPLIGELNTHRTKSRNSASSRAVSIIRRIKMLLDRPHIPMFQRITKGMRPGELFSDGDQKHLEKRWLEWRDVNIEFAKEFTEAGVHQQWVSRPLEAWMETEVVITATEWDNFFNLRILGGAQTEMRETARAIKEAMLAHTPTELKEDEWSLPFITYEVEDWVDNYIVHGDMAVKNPTDLGLKEFILCLISAGRCATVSWDNLGLGVDPQKDLSRAENLIRAGHWSCFEHQAKALPVELGGRPTYTGRSGNLRGWLQFRKCIPGEEVWIPPVV